MHYDRLKYIREELIGEDEIVQRKLEGRCQYCGQPDGKHTFNCPEMSNKRFMFGEKFITDPDNDYFADKKSDM